MLRWLLRLKILGRNNRNLLLKFFIAHLKYLKDFHLVLSLGLQGVDIGLNRRGGLWRGRRNWGLGFSGADSLGMRISSNWSTSGVVALVSVVAFLPAVEAESFLDASHSFHGG